MNKEEELIIKMQTYIERLKLAQNILDSMPFDKANDIVKKIVNIDLNELEKRI